MIITVHEDISHLALKSGWLGVVHSKGFLERFLLCYLEQHFLGSLLSSPSFLSSSLTLTVTEQTPCRQQECHTSETLPFLEAEGNSRVIPNTFLPAYLGSMCVFTFTHVRLNVCMCSQTPTWSFQAEKKKKTHKSFPKADLFMWPSEHVLGAKGSLVQFPITVIHSLVLISGLWGQVCTVRLWEDMAYHIPSLFLTRELFHPEHF